MAKPRLDVWGDDDGDGDDDDVDGDDDDDDEDGGERILGGAPVSVHKGSCTCVGSSFAISFSTFTFHSQALHGLPSVHSSLHLISGSFGSPPGKLSSCRLA